MPLLMLLLCLLIPVAQAQLSEGGAIGGSNGGATHFPGPQTYRDPASGITFYVESDGLHVAALSKQGKILWVRDPFHEAKMSDYRTHQPQIVEINKGRWRVKPFRHRYLPAIFIRFNSSQFGVMKINDGEFRFQGQD